MSTISVGSSTEQLLNQLRLEIRGTIENEQVQSRITQIHDAVKALGRDIIESTVQSKYFHDVETPDSDTTTLQSSEIAAAMDKQIAAVLLQLKLLVQTPVQVVHNHLLIAKQNRTHDFHATKIQTIVRKWLVRRKFRAVIERARKRTRVLRELVETERSYVHFLTVTKSMYITPLLHNELLSQEEVDCIFKNTESLRALNLDLLAHLEKRYTNVTHRMCVGDLFVKFSPFFKLYGEYMNNYEAALKLLTQLNTTNEKFVAFIAKCQEDPICEQQSLQSLLIKPVQRVMKYPLLLQELKNYTGEEHEDYRNLTAAITTLKRIAAELNESKRKAENSVRLHEISALLKGDHVPVLVQAGRTLIREGTMQVKQDDGIPQTRVLFLFNDCIIFAAKRLFDSKLQFKTQLHVHRLIVQDAESSGGSFLISLRYPRARFTLYCSDAGEKELWLDDLQKITAQAKNALTSMHLSRSFQTKAAPIVNALQQLALLLDTDLNELSDLLSHQYKLNELVELQQVFVTIRSALERLDAGLAPMQPASSNRQSLPRRSSTSSTPSPTSSTTAVSPHTHYPHPPDPRTSHHYSQVPRRYSTQISPVNLDEAQYLEELRRQAQLERLETCVTNAMRAIDSGKPVIGPVNQILLRLEKSEHELHQQARSARVALLQWFMDQLWPVVDQH